MRSPIKAAIGCLLLCIPVLFYSCEDEFLPGLSGEGDLIEQELELRDFEGFINAISADIVLTQGDEQRVVVVGQENIIDNLRTDVFGELWTIRYNDLVRRAEKLTIYITLPKLDHIGIAGSGNISTTNRFDEIKDLDLVISGSGNIDFSGDVKKMGVLITGSGDITLEGKSEKMEILVSGSGIMDAYRFQTEDADLTITGSGSLYLQVSNLLKVTISGSGDVYFRGDPEIQSRITGSGNIFDDN